MRATEKFPPWFRFPGIVRSVTSDDKQAVIANSTGRMVLSNDLNADGKELFGSKDNKSKKLCLWEVLFLNCVF